MKLDLEIAARGMSEPLKGMGSAHATIGCRNLEEEICFVWEGYCLLSDGVWPVQFVCAMYVKKSA